jgi:N-ethylmaleimide reductase
MDLFTPFVLGDLTLQNRLVMAPMTRSRAVENNVPSPLAPLYYQQRASAGLIITEATQVHPRGVGYIRTPGIYSEAQIAGWKKVTDAVHAVNGKIFMQLWHVGRVSHPDFHHGELPLAPSALPVEGQVFTPDGLKNIEIPQAIATDKIPEIIEQFKLGAKHAKAAGFDGIELHGANGYLLDQFLRDGSNKRQDNYGGNLQNRLRFPLEVTRAVLEVWPANRVGYKIHPYFSGYSMSDSNPEETFSALTSELSKLHLSYLHVTETVGEKRPLLAPILRNLFQGAFMLNGGYDLASGNEAIAQHKADLIAYGVLFLANPDLPERFQKKSNLNTPNRETFYSGEEKGYIDYPSVD